MPRRTSPKPHPSGVIVAIAALLLILTACSAGDGDDPTATTETLAQEATPTEVVVEPTATAEPEPTETPTPSPEPEPSATPTRVTAAPTVAAPIYRPPTAAPTVAPEPTPETDLPDDEGSIGDLLLDTDLTDWPAVEFDFGQGFVGEGGYHIHNAASDGSAIFLRSEEYSYTDIVVSLDLRMLTETPDAYGCLISHADWESTNFNYSVCVNGWGESYAAYEYVDADGNYQYEILVEVAIREIMNPATEWNNLSIISVGNDFGFFINDELIGVANHAGSGSGSVGFYVSNYDVNPAEYLFTNMLVWAVQ